LSAGNRHDQVPLSGDRYRQVTVISW